MFKKRAKAKHPTSSSAISRLNSTVGDNNEDASSISKPEPNPAKDLEVRPQLTIEELRNRYDPSIGMEPLTSNRRTSPLASSNSSEVGSSTRPTTPNILRAATTDSADMTFPEALDDDWEVEQLRKVGVKTVTPGYSNASMEDIASRLERRLNELRSKEADLVALKEKLESELELGSNIA